MITLCSYSYTSVEQIFQQLPATILEPGHLENHQDSQEAPPGGIDEGGCFKAFGPNPCSEEQSVALALSPPLAPPSQGNSYFDPAF